MKVLISGAGGFVGRELARHFSARHEVLALRRDDLDITNQQSVGRLILNERPALIINCAVLGVDACESSPERAWTVNVSGAQSLAAAASEVRAELVHFSSNYVFDGKREAGTFYTINDKPAPTNVYGKTKLAGERAACEASRRTYIVRTSWVFDSGKDNFASNAPRLLMAAQPLRAVTDVWASTIYVADLVVRLEEILARRHYGIYHVVNEGVCSYYEFALEVAYNLGMTKGEIGRLIEPVKESEMQRPSLRPRYTPMKCLLSERLGLAPMRDWRKALSEFLQYLR